MALRSSKSKNSDTNSKRDFCDRPGHNMNNCFINPNNPDNRLPSKILEVVNESKGKLESLAELEQKNSPVKFSGCVTDSTSVSPSNHLRTYADSGASTHIFQAKNAFVSESLKSCDHRTVCLADNANATAKTRGKVI